MTVGGAPPRTADASALYARYRPTVYSFCLRRLEHREDASDAVQDTFMKAWIAQRDGHEVRQPLPWLLTIARNVCIDRRRALGVRPALSPLSERAEAALPPPSSDELVDFSAAVRALPERQRRAFVLRVLLGCSYDEIAEDLGVSHSSVAALVHRSRRAVAGRLAGARRRVVAALPLPFMIRSALQGGGAGAATGATAACVAALVAVPLATSLAEQFSSVPAPPPARVAAVSASPGSTASKLRISTGRQSPTTSATVQRDTAVTTVAPDTRTAGSGPNSATVPASGEQAAVAPTDDSWPGHRTQAASAAAAPGDNDVPADVDAGASGAGDEQLSAAPDGATAGASGDVGADGDQSSSEPVASTTGPVGDLGAAVDEAICDPGSRGNGRSVDPGSRGHGRPCDPGAQGRARQGADVAGRR